MTPADRRPRRAVLAGVLAALTLLTACESGSASPAPPSSSTTSSATPDGPPAPTAYVALGDSYASAPFVPTTDVASGCLRSTGNYPTLVAARLDPGAFVDVSCSGAASSDVVGRQRVLGGSTVPPQLRALRKDAQLVTVGIGGNDGNLFSQLVCSFNRGLAPCRRLSFAASTEETLANTRVDLTAALRRVVRRAAPDALVLLVGYPRLVDTDRTCPALPLKPGQQDELAIVEQRLRTTMRTSAADAGVEFLDLWPASRGHEICGDDPWVNGKDTDRTQALAYHPFASEQEAVAELVEQRWQEHAS